MAVSHGAAQKQQEQQCLQIALDARKYQKGESKRILDLLAGQDVPRKSDERPDFVRRTLPRSKRDKGVLLGIEHFRVDHLSLKKADGKVASRGVCLSNKLAHIYEKWHSKLNENRELPDEYCEPAVHDMMKLMSDWLSVESNTNYYSLLASMDHALTKHLESTNVYYETLKKLALPDEKVEMAFLIEVHENFFADLIYDKNGIRRCKLTEAPLLTDMVHLLEEKVSSMKVQYVILCLGNINFDRPVQTIAIRTKDIQAQLSKRHVPTFEYVSADKFFQAFSGCPFKTTYSYDPKTTKLEDGVFTVSFDTEMQHIQSDLFAKLTYETIQEIYRCILEHKNFITTPTEYSYAQALLPEYLLSGLCAAYNVTMDRKESMERVWQRMDTMREQFNEYGEKLSKDIGQVTFSNSSPGEKKDETTI